MSAKFINVDRETPMLFPPDLRDWIPENDLVHFVIDAVETLNLSEFSVNHRGSGSPQYPPSMMLALLIYSYATGRFSSREIEQATYLDVAIRYICGGDKHPDHDTICAFRLKNRKVFKEAFVKVLMIASEVGNLKKVGGISVDGTKLKANASKHSAVSYKRALEKIKQLELEIEELTRKAEEADNTPLQDGLTIPEEISRRQNRKEALRKACNIIEERYEEIHKEKQAEYEEKKNKRDKDRDHGKKPRGKEPKPPKSTPPDNMQLNFTDEESRIMKAGNGKHYEQSYNGQAAVDTEGSMLILGKYVTNHVNDKRELEPCVNSVDPSIRNISDVSADTGYFSEQAILAVEADSKGPTVYCAVEKYGHHRTVQDLEKKEDPPAPEKDAPLKEIMVHRLKTQNGKERYKLRKETVEPVFGIIKSVMGFRQFLLRGLKKVELEWDLVTLSYNIKRLHRLNDGKALSSLL
jgi:transposase